MEREEAEVWNLQAFVSERCPHVARILLLMRLPRSRFGNWEERASKLPSANRKRQRNAEDVAEGAGRRAPGRISETNPSPKCLQVWGGLGGTQGNSHRCDKSQTLNP